MGSLENKICTMLLPSMLSLGMFLLSNGVCAVRNNINKICTTTCNALTCECTQICSAMQAHIRMTGLQITDNDMYGESISFGSGNNLFQALSISHSAMQKNSKIC